MKKVIKKKVIRTKILITLTVFTVFICGVIFSSRSLPSATYIDDNIYKAADLAECLREGGYSIEETQEICSNTYNKFIITSNNNELSIYAKLSNGDRRLLKVIKFDN